MSGLERCWASEVSGCGEGPPRAATHSDALVVGSLCAKHAAELAPLDIALGDLINSTHEIERLREVRSQVSKNWPAFRLTVDGFSIERCVLKMMMNHARVQSRELNDWRPPDWLPSFIFGAERLKPGCGLAVVVRVGDAIVDRERIRFTFAQSDRRGVYDSVVLELRQGLRLVCSWKKPVQALGELRFDGTYYDAASDVLWHPRRVSFSNGKLDLGLSLDFDWSGKWNGSKHPAVTALRGKGAPPTRR